MKVSQLLQAAANLVRLHEDPELRARFAELVRTRGRAAAIAWLDEHAEAAGLDSAMVERIKRELGA